MSHSHQRLWDFALKLYAAPGVAEACLILQDESGVDVPVLLSCAWLSKNGVTLTAAEIARIDGLVKEWHETVVKPLRAVRRLLKTGPAPAPTKETETLRNGVKGVELSSEKIELAMLEAEGNALIAADMPRGETIGNLARALFHYRSAEPDAAAAGALSTIEQALATL